MKKGSSLSQKILKVMALFTGMQFFTVLCTIIKTKLVALWLSADGVGLFGILTTTTETTGTLTDLGLRQSAVRDVAQTASNPTLLSRMAAVVRRWSLFTGLLGAVVISGLCIPLSLWFFGTAGRWWMFALMSAVMLLNAVAGGEQALLQGAQRFKPLLRISTWGAAGGLLVSVPLLRWGGLTGVIWTVIAYSACTLAAALILRLRTPQKPKITVSEVIKEGSGFVRLGTWMAVAAFVTSLAQMAFMAYLSGFDSLQEVGFYQAGITLVVRYMGLIFTAMAMEYYPRLSANIFSAKRTSMFVNHEARVLLTVLIPVIALFLLLRQWIVVLLYRPEFAVMIPFISWAVLSCVFKATSWSMAFVILARGNGTVYVLTESIDAVIGLTLCIAGYRLMGLEGVGIAFIAWYALYMLITGWVYVRRYRLHLAASTLWMTLLCFLLGLGELLAMKYLPYWLCCLLCGSVAVVSLPFLRRIWRR